jgi:hypothetical protein
MPLPRRDLGHLFGRALGNKMAAAGTAFGAEVDDVVRGLDHVEVVLDHDDGVACVDQAAGDLQELVDVGEVQSRGGIVEDIDGAAGGLLD